MKALVIGYGSIGKRHEEVLRAMSCFTSIDIVSRQALQDKDVVYKHLTDVDLEQYAYIVIASDTDKHAEQLAYIESKTFNKIILCEKPLFSKNERIDIAKNSVYVGYVLRAHPLLLTLKEEMAHDKIVHANILSGSYLPWWRPGADYRQSYSASKKRGGGALLDLSHEVDYVHWLFGSLDQIKSYQKTVSDLEIDSDDIMVCMGVTNRGTLVSMALDYISKVPYRRVIAQGNEATYDLDLVANTLVIKSKAGLVRKLEVSNLERNHLFERMHTAALQESGKGLCTYKDGLSVMETIFTIQQENQ